MGVFITLVCMAGFAWWLLWRDGTFRSPELAAGAALLALAAMLLRGPLLSYETLDYQDFLARWVEYFREYGAWYGLSRSVGNYNVPYLYVLALISLVNFPDLYLIKLFSVFFDIILAWGVMRIVRLFRPEPKTWAAAFFVTLFLPTVILNGAYWGQCDSVYGAFAVLSAAFALERKSAWSVVCAALSFAFKLQAVFILPVLLVFLFTGRIEWKHLPLFPAVYLIIALPAIIAGRPVADTVLLYFNQAGSAGDGLNYNSSSIFAFATSETDKELFSMLGVVAAAVYLALMYLWSFLRRREMTDAGLLAVTLLICVGVPFLLPHMHDRYFFIADAVSVAFAFAVPWLAVTPVLVSFASYLGYYAYLHMRFLTSMRYGAVALICVLILTGGYAAMVTRGNPGETALDSFELHEEKKRDVRP